MTEAEIQLQKQKYRECVKKKVWWYACGNRGLALV